VIVRQAPVKCLAIEISGGWAGTSLVPFMLFLLGSVMTAVFDMLKGRLYYAK